MFDKSFYPTTKEIYEMLCVNPHGKVVLEPSAGKGDMIQYLKDDGAKSVLACEFNSDLAIIARQKADHFICNNFFDVVSEQVSHVDIIVMNPPFDNADKHLLHAWGIAPEGCEIYALMNEETIENPYTKKRKELKTLIESYGGYYSIGKAFSNAERVTDVEVVVVTITKPESSFKTEFADFFTQEADDAFGGSEGLMTYNEIRSIVQRYVRGCEDYKDLRTKAYEMHSNLIKLGISQNVKVELTYGTDTRDYEGFKKELQKASWKYVFDKLGMEKYLTSGVKDDLNKFIEENQKYPFTMKNIYSMIDVLIQTRSQTMKRAIMEAVDNFTKHTHENRYSVEGWKTNSGHMLNQKIIINGLVTSNYSGSLRITHYWPADKLRDLIKAICFLTGRDYDKYQTALENATAPRPLIYSHGYIDADGKVDNTKPRYPRTTADGGDRFIANTWYKVEDLFEIKVFKKGTAHLKFIDLKAWEILNRTYGEILGQALPEKI